MYLRLKNIINHSLSQKILRQYGLPALFFIIVFFFYPGRTQFPVSWDEGVELQKSMLVTKGFTLYDEIWSDQPPFVTYILALVFRLFGYRTILAQGLVLLLSAMLLWAIGQILRLIWGLKISLMGMSLTIILPAYLDLSTTVMIGLPSIAFAAVSLWALLEWHNHRKYH